MDPIAVIENLLSRGPSPPLHQPFQLPPTQSSEQQQVVSPPAQQQSSAATAASALDSLFQTLAAPAQPQVSPQPSAAVSNTFSGPSPDVPHSGPATPGSVNAGSVSSSLSGPNHPSADRANALLSLLTISNSPTVSNVTNPQTAAPSAPQQVPTPPGSAPRVPATSSESQGKLLLEQLMSG